MTTANDNDQAEGHQLKRGTQVLYIPEHAVDLNDPVCEQGFVTHVPAPGTHVFVRYFHADGSLRTWANSELTPVNRLWEIVLRPQEEIASLLRELGYDRS